MSSARRRSVPSQGPGYGRGEPRYSDHDQRDKADRDQQHEHGQADSDKKTLYDNHLFIPR
jgi:hypothetical protein